MEFDGDQENTYSRSGRQIFGAIFMANRRTKQECLERKLFGLPPPQDNFVKKVKSGMILFLFEFEERKLYGVFQASSDGAMNIVPHAFSSSGKQFPAQIRTKRIWYCNPLLERDFRDAIIDNYYTANKFNLGLSKDQVSKLLCLFDSRRFKIPKSKSPLLEMNNEPVNLARDSSAVGMDVKTSPEAFAAVGQVVPFHVESENSSLLPMRSGGLGVATNLGDFIPLDYQDHFHHISSSRLSPQSLSSRHRTASLTNPTFSRHDSFGPGKDPPYVPDNHFPAALRHEEYQLQVGIHPLDSTSINPSDVERGKEGGAYIGLRSDIENKRASVFSRLKHNRNDTMQDDDNCRGKKDQEDNTSVNQLMDMLNRFDKQWTTSTKKSRDNVRINDVDDEEQQYYDVLVEETSVNFKRRNKFRKMHGEVEGRMEESDGLSCTLSRKRRKLLRPSFVSGRTCNDGVIDDMSLNTGRLPQEIFERKDGESSEALTTSYGGEGNGNESSQKSGLEIVVHPMCSEHKSGNTEICQDKGGGSSNNNGDEGNEKKTHQNSIVQVVVHPISDSQGFKLRVETIIRELNGGIKEAAQ